MVVRTILAVITLAATAAPAAAQRAPALDVQGSPQVNKLLDCRSIADPTERLACFDREAGVTQEALARRDIVVVDRAEVVKSRRSLFGFALPSLAIFGGGDEDQQEEMREIEGVVAGAARGGDNNWVIKLQEGGTWTQTDGRSVSVNPKRGQKVLIKRNALGGFMLSYEGSTGIRVRRTG